jgi:chromosomal replication initiator protein
MRKHPTPDEIIEAVGLFYGLTRKMIESEKRTRAIALCRHMIFYIANKMTILSTTEIGRYVGGFDHTTVLHGINRVTLDFDLEKESEVIMENLRESLELPAPTG